MEQRAYPQCAVLSSFTYNIICFRDITLVFTLFCRYWNVLYVQLKICPDTVAAIIMQYLLLLRVFLNSVSFHSKTTNYCAVISWRKCIILTWGSMIWRSVYFPWLDLISFTSVTAFTILHFHRLVSTMSLSFWMLSHIFLSVCSHL